MILPDDPKDSLGFGKICSLIAREAVSGSGRLKIEQLLPLSNINEILIQQERISALCSVLDEGEEFPLAAFEDIRENLKKCRVEGAYFDIKTLSHIRRILTQCETVRRYFVNHKKQLKAIAFLVARLQTLHPVLRLINRIISDKGEIKDNASPNLLRIRKAAKHEVNRLHREISMMMEKAREEGWLHEENPTIREGRLVLPLKTESKRRIKGIIHGQSGTGATTFVEPLEIIEINNQLKDLEQEEKEEIEIILRQTTEKTKSNFPEIEQNIIILIEIDLLRACALFSRKFQCTPPKIVEDNRSLILLKARHPLLSLVKEVVPLNVSISDEIRAVIITGPNAGGKTVAMKTIGLLGAMAMTGLHIPADEGSQIPFFDDFLVDIGDLQSIENDLSTFSSHMSNLKSFLDKAKTNSLILIDELGTGTDPVEGSALGQAILEKLILRGAFAIITTHHTALKVFAEMNSQVINAGMEFDAKNLTPNYRFRPGIPGNSYALEISKQLGLPEPVIDRARNLMGDDAVRLKDMLLQIETLREKLESEDSQIVRNKRTLDKLVSEYESRVEFIRHKQEKIDKELANELEKAVRESRSRIENAIRKIKEQKASKGAILNAKRIVEQMEKESEEKRKTAKKIQGEQKIAKDSWVRIEGVSEPGQVIGFSKKNSRVSVNVNGKILLVPVDAVSLLETEISREVNSKEPVLINADESPSNHLNLRGMRVEEAEGVLLKFIDQAILSGLTRIEIVYGKGTGALQKMVWEKLKTFPGISKFQFEDFDRGGTGATIVELE